MWIVLGLFAFFALGGLATYLKERDDLSRYGRK